MASVENGGATGSSRAAAEPEGGARTLQLASVEDVEATGSSGAAAELEGGVETL